MSDELFWRMINVVGQTYTGTVHNDTQDGTGDDDTFNYFQGGNDTLHGEGGNDTFNLRGTLTAADAIDGGTGNDTLTLKGDYTAQLTFAPTTLSGVETIRLLGGAGANFAFDDANLAAGTQLQIDAHLLGKDSTLIVNGQNETDGAFVIDGGSGTGFYSLGAGDDVVYGGKAPAQIDPGTGTDHITGSTGDDFVGFRPGALDASDYVNGGSGNDEVAEILTADQSVTMSEQTIAYVERFMLTAAANAGEIHVAFTMAEGNVSAHKALDVGVFEGFNAKMDLTLDASAETDGSYDITAGAGDDMITGGAKNDVIRTGAGVDHAYGGFGDDNLYAGSDFGSGEIMDGGTGFDTLHLSGTYSLFGISSGMIPQIEKIQIDSDTDVSMAVLANAVSEGVNLIIDATAMSSAHRLDFNGDQESSPFTLLLGAGADQIVAGNGDDKITGGGGDDYIVALDGNDTINGGGGDDVLIGLGGRDTITPGAGHDDIQYGAVDQSTGKNYDEIIGFDPRDDTFLAYAATGVDHKIRGGALSRSSMNADLAAAVDAAHLEANHAVLFAPDSGDLHGTLFLILDVNGVAGYQTNKDMVFLLTDASHIGALSAANFETS